MPTIALKRSALSSKKKYSAPVVTPALEQIERRMAKSTEQMKTAYDYDYVVMNDDLETAVQDVVHIIGTVRRRTMLHRELIDQINATFVEE